MGEGGAWTDEKRADQRRRPADQQDLDHTAYLERTTLSRAM